MPRKSSRTIKPNKRYYDNQNENKSDKNMPLKKNVNVKSANQCDGNECHDDADDYDHNEQITIQSYDINEEIGIDDDEHEREDEHEHDNEHDNEHDEHDDEHEHEHEHERDNESEYVPENDDEEINGIEENDSFNEHDYDPNEDHHIVTVTHYDNTINESVNDGSALVLISEVPPEEEQTHELSQLPQLGLAPDLVIAEAVQVMITQYQCKFCIKRFDTIDKVKSHYLKRHFGQTPVTGGYAIKLMENNNDTIKDDNEMDNDFEYSTKHVNDKDCVIIQTNTDSYTVTKAKKLKRDLPNNLQIKLIPAVDSDTPFHRKRGRPRKYEERMVNHKDPERQYACPFEGCEYIAKYRSNLWDHKKTHTGEKPYPCSWPGCSSRFTQAQQLKLHLRSHTGERPFECQWLGCNKRFSQKPGLKAHMRTHTGEKPFACDWPGCAWRFTLKGALTDHRRAVHENVKTFLCEWPGCNKKFLQSCHLRKHMMSHADIKPYLCDWPGCEYRAVSMAYVTNHRKTHTGEKNFECKIGNCCKKFTKSSHVRRHQLRFHPNDVPETNEIEIDDEEMY